MIVILFAFAFILALFCSSGAYYYQNNHSKPTSSSSTSPFTTAAAAALSSSTTPFATATAGTSAVTSSTAPPRRPEVYYVGGYEYTKDHANSVCQSRGASLATAQQLGDAASAKADWCATGWLSDDSPSYPITTSIGPGCAFAPGVVKWLPPSGLAGATCYGPKPINSGGTKVLPYSQGRWSVFD